MQEEKIVIPQPQQKNYLINLKVVITLVIIAAVSFSVLVYLIPKFIIPSIIFYQAEKAFKLKEDPKAMQKYQQIIKDYPSFVKKHPDIYYHLGITYITQNKPYRASASFSKFLESNAIEEKLSPENRYIIGLAFSETQKYYQAIQQLEKVSPSQSKIIKNADYYVALAEAYFGKNKFDKAMIAANKTLEFADNKPSQARTAHLVKYLIFSKEGKIAEADKEIELVNKLRTKDTMSMFEASFYLDNLYYLDQSGNPLKEVEHRLQTVQDLDSLQKALLYRSLAYFYKDNGDYTKALEYAQKIIEIDPDFLPGYYLLGNIYTYKEDYKKALEYDQKAMEIDDSDPWVRNGIGWTNYNLSQLQIAKEHLKKAVVLDPEFTIALDNLGLTNLALGNYQEAVVSFDKAIEIDPKYKKPYLNKGSVYLEQKQYEKGLEFYKKALEIDPEYALAYYAIGDLYLRQKNYQQAINNFQIAQKLDPRHLDTYKALAESYVALGQLQNAIDEFNKGIKINPDDGGFYIGLADIYKDLGEMEKSNELFSKGLSLQPQDGAAHAYNLGLQLKKQKKYTEAKEQLIKTIKLEPDNISAYIVLAQVYEDLASYDEAIKLLEKSITIDPEEIDVYDNLGTIYSKKGDYKAAIETYKKGLTLPLSIQDPVVIGRIYEGLGLVYYNNTKQLDLAEEAFKNALKYNPKQPIHYLNLGETYRVQGKLEEAKKQLRIAIQLDPKDALAHNNLGYTLALQGKIDEAIKEFKKALEIDPTLKIAQENLNNYQNKK